MTQLVDTLDANQRANATAIVAETKALGLPLAAAQIAVTTAMTESGLYSQANSSVPESLNLPHQKVGSDGTSVGIFQQQNSWGTAAQRLNPATATQLFFARLPSGWQTMDPGAVAQKIQVSAYPGRYDTNYSAGSAVASELWGSTQPGASNVLLSTGTGNTGMTEGAPVAPGTGEWLTVNGKPLVDPPVNNQVGTNPNNWNIDSDQAGTYYQYAIPVTTAKEVPATTCRQAEDWANKYNENTALTQKAPYNDQATATIVNAYNAAVSANCARTGKTKQINVDPGPAVPGLGLSNPLDFINKIFKWITTPSNWIRIGLWALGGAILLFVVWSYIKPDIPSGTVIPVPV